MGYNCTKRKSEIRIHEVLPNGMHLNLYFFRKRDDLEFKRWYVGLCISKTRKEANFWFSKRSKRKKSEMTGDGSLTGLKRALEYILLVVNNLSINEELIIQWEDTKRCSAYRYLKRYGFTDYLDNDDVVIGYGTRNPKYWEYLEG